ncbi:MAG: sigma-70 family RNA polymerase sigma factor [Opitutaceae bacterium]|nr:sigma-70 family RNA polymerase sigma factor [Opitutaceae bacterium]
MKPARPLEAIFAQRTQFRAFLISRLGNEADADDVLQNGLVKAMRSAGDVGDEQKLTAWFYRLLQNALVDHVRSRSAGARRDDAWAAGVSQPDDVAVKTVCSCFEGLLVEMKSRDAELLRRVELGDEPVASAAQALGMSAGNASVTLHRARAALRKKLEEFCGDCAKGACLDCDCADARG